MKAKSNLKLVKAPDTKLNVLDQLNEVRAKYTFLREAIVNLWGNEHTEYGEEYVFGCNLLMADVGDELKEIHKALDPEYVD
jgi:hypothetical protein